MHIAEQILQKCRGADSAKFCKNVRNLLQKWTSPILYHKELSIGDALIICFVLDRVVRVGIDQCRDCRFFLVSKLNRQTLIDVIRVNALRDCI